MNYYKMSRTQEDGTYDLITGERVSFTKGYQFSFERPGMSEKDVNDIAKFFNEELGFTLYVGVWNGVRELSLYTDREFSYAKELARIWDQEAIWDWAKMEAITIK